MVVLSHFLLSEKAFFLIKTSLQYGIVITLQNFRIMRNLLLIIFLFLSLTGVADNNPVRFRQYDIESGLFNNQARRVIVMPNGRILVQVDGMFCLFDGQNFHQLSFDRRKSMNIESFLNTDYYFDRQDRLWIRGYQHLSVFDANDYQLLSVKEQVEGSGVKTPFKNFFIDADGNAWIYASDATLYFYDWNHSAVEIRQITDRNDEGITLSICDLIQVGQYHYIFLSSGTMVCWDNKKKEIRYTKEMAMPQMAHTLKALPWGKDSFIYRNSEGLLLYNTTTHLASQLLTDNNVLDFRKADNGDLWVSARGNIYHLNSQLQLTDTICNAIDERTGLPLPSNWQGIAIDRQGGLWACTTSNGVYYHRQNDPFVKQIEMTGQEGQDISFRHFLYPYAATSDGLMCYDTSTAEFSPVCPQLKDIPCRRVSHDSKGMLWITTTDGRIFSYQPATGAVEAFTPDNVKGLLGSIPFCIELEEDCYLTCVRLNRLSLFYPKEHRLEILTTRFPELLQYRNMVDACKLGDDYLIGTQNGFFVYNNSKQTIEYDQAKLLNENPYTDKCNAILESSDGTLWLGMQNGLFHFDPVAGTIERYRKSADGLPSSCIQSLAQDNDGNLWIATVNGLAFMNLSNSEKPTFFIFGTDDGLGKPTFNEGAATVTAEGVVMFGYDKGIVTINPQHTELPTFQLNPLLVAAYIRDNIVPLSYPFNDLSYDENYLAFDVSALNYSYPQHTMYRYKLEGVDREWKEEYGGGGRMTIRYTALDPGSYTLLVEASMQGQPWGETLRVPIRIRPPFWKSGWAYTVYNLLGFFLIVYLVRNYLRRQKERLALESREKEELNREQLNSERQRFFTNVTHELRTPLTLILGPLDDLCSDTSLSEPVRKKVKSIHGSAERLLQLVNQLLELRKSETYNRKLQIRQLSLADHVSEILQHFSDLNVNPRLHYEISIQQESMDNLWFDPEVIGIILNNLLSNAQKFTPSGTIRLSLADADDGKIQLSVSDTGYGIPSDVMPHIFNRFYQGHAHYKANSTGIGLSLVKSLCELHHAQVTVNSDEGKGTTFNITFNRKDLETPPQAPTGAASSTDGSKPAGNDDQPTYESVLPTLLIVEDNEEIRKYIIDSLSPDYTCLEASNGREGTELAFANIPDIIITDLMMPQMDGNTMCRLLKEDLRTSHIPVVMLTAKDSLTAKEEGFESGADSYLTKPFTARLLRACIANITEQRRRLSTRLLQQAKVVTQQDSKKKDAAPVLPPLADTPAAPTKPEPTQQLSRLDQQFLDKLNALIDENLSNSELDMNYLTDHMAMSRATLFRKVKAIIGISTNEYIRKVRLHRAASRLLSNDYSDSTISAIAYDCGFSSLSYFRSCFKDEFGVLPKEYATGKRNH